MGKRISWWLIGMFLTACYLVWGASVAAKNGTYEVVSPLGRSTAKIVPLSPRLSTLEGKKIGFVWHVFANGDVLANAFADLLGKRFKNIESVKLPSGKGLKWSDYPDPSIKDIVKNAKIDALIATVGGWGTCTPAVARSTAWTEAAGIPAVGIVCTGFIPTAHSVAEAEGVPDIRIVEYPPPNISAQSPAEVRKYAEALVDKVIEALTKEATTAKRGTSVVEAGPKDIVFKGTFEEVNKFFYENQWTDGLPIVPPTIEKVKEFLRYTDRSPDEVIGILPPGKREATVWKVAVNGVMAGCRPEYMPVLIAVAEAVTDPHFGIQHAGSTSGWAPLIILNGPIIKQLDFNYGPGVTRPGRQANTTISRFLRLLMVNIPRYLIGVTDKATFGQNYFIALVEAEGDSLWEPLSVDRGFKAGANVVTVTSAETISDAFASFGTGERHLKTIAWQAARLLSTVPVILRFGRERSIIVAMSPLIANLIAKSGYSKSDVKEYLFKNVRMRASEFDTILVENTACGLVAAGRLEKQFCESTDPDRMLPLVHSPNDFLIVVSGDPTRNRTFVTLQGGDQGLATSKEIKLPTNWDKLMNEVAK